MSGSSLMRLLTSTSGGRGARVREVFEGRDGLLCAVGVELLREARDQPGTRQVIAQLMSRGLLGAVYGAVAESDPGAAGQVMHLASRVDGTVERRLLRAEGAGRAQWTDEEAGALAEWLHVLAGVAAAALAGGDARLRARMALAWGRAAQIGKMGAQWLEDADARVRANAVESLWGRGDGEALEIFRRKLGDSHQRVAANAAVGLYLAGENEAVAALHRMASGQDPARRAAAVWAMGRTGDARFLPVLAEMRRTHPAPVSLMRNVVVAKERIRHAEEIPREGVAVEAVAAGGAEVLQLDVRVRREDGEPVRGLRPVDFCVEVNGAVVWDYHAWPQPRGGGAAVWLLAPGETREEAALRAREMVEQAGEAVRDLIQGTEGFADAEGLRVDRKVGDVLGLGGAQEGGEGDGAGRLESWQEMVARCARRLAGGEGERHVVVMVERDRPEWLAKGIERAAAICREGGALLDVLQEAGALPAAAQAAARSSGGTVTTVQRGAFGGALRKLAEGWTDTWRIEVAGTGLGGVQRLRVAVRSGRYRGETELERGGAPGS